MKQTTPKPAVQSGKVRDIAASARDSARAALAAAKIEMKTAGSRNRGSINIGATSAEVANCGAPDIADVANCGATIAEE